MVFTADSRTVFSYGLLWKYELNLGRSHWSCSVKKLSLENLHISQEHSCNSLFLMELQTFTAATLLKRGSTQIYSCGIYEIFKNT